MQVRCASSVTLDHHLTLATQVVVQAVASANGVTMAGILTGAIVNAILSKRFGNLEHLVESSAPFAINSTSAIVTVKDKTMLEATTVQVFVNVDGTRVSDTKGVVITIQLNAVRSWLFLEEPLQ